jgi:hypothetical protein
MIKLIAWMKSNDGITMLFKYSYICRNYKDCVDLCKEGSRGFALSKLETWAAGIG